MNDIPRRPICRFDPSERLAAEAARLDEIKARAQVPAECGGAIPSAPGRGAFVMYTPRETVRTDSGAIRVRPAGYAGRRGLRVGDAFDTMQAQSQRSRKSRNSDDAAAPLFTTAQLTAGREYAAVWERHDKAGVRCSSLEAQQRSGNAGGSYMDALLADRERLRRWQAAIGDGWAMEPRRMAPHGDRRRAIRVAEVVDMVCLRSMTVAQVLDRFGWGRGVRTVEPIMRELRAALDRMYDADRR